jgi:hypothetical protein
VQRALPGEVAQVEEEGNYSGDAAARVLLERILVALHTTHGVDGRPLAGPVDKFLLVGDPFNTHTWAVSDPDVFFRKNLDALIACMRSDKTKKRKHRNWDVDSQWVVLEKNKAGQVLPYNMFGLRIDVKRLNL